MLGRPLQELISGDGDELAADSASADDPASTAFASSLPLPGLQPLASTRTA